jgi:hypothetical protein
MLLTIAATTREFGDPEVLVDAAIRALRSGCGQQNAGKPLTGSWRITSRLLRGVVFVVSDAERRATRA